MLSFSRSMPILGLFLSVLLIPMIAGFNAPKADPIIGLVAQPLHAEDEYSSPFIAASYVKWLEGAGARVVVLKYSMEKDELDGILPHIDGVQFPGGDLTILEKHQRYRSFVNTVVTFAETVNTSGGYFALWGTCMGYESIAIGLAHMNTSILGAYESWDQTLSLTLMDGFKTSVIGQSMDSMTREVIQHESLFLNTHRGGIHPNTFVTNPVLGSILTPLTTNNDLNGETFVSMYEGIDRPYWGTQFHPEMVPFEYTTKNHINRSAIAIQVNQSFAKFFVDQARNGSAKHSSVTDGLLIWNYTPVYEPGNIYYQQTYYNL